tara:strand:+ start:274 stop:435 length:162 start_codon:yes stop_codon:yes gene_type:complete
MAKKVNKSSSKKDIKKSTVSEYKNLEGCIDYNGSGADLLKEVRNGTIKVLKGV